MDGPVDNPMDNIPVAQQVDHRPTTTYPPRIIWITVIILILFSHPETVT